MISKCIIFARDMESESRVTVFKSGFEGMFILFYEDPFFTSEFEYVNRQNLLEKFPSLSKDIDQI